MRNSAGIPIVLNFSMPPSTPLMMTTAQIAMKIKAKMITVSGKNVVSAAAL